MKIAIVKLTAMGDIIQSAFLLQFLKKHIKNIDIDWYVEEVFAPVLEYNPYVNIKKLNLKSLKKNKLNLFSQIKKIKEFSKNDYDLILDLQALLKSAITARLLGKNVVGYDKNSAREKAAAFLYKKGYYVPYHYDTLDRYRLLANKVFDIDIKKEDVLEKEPFLYFSKDDDEAVKKYFKNDMKNVVFIIGASWESKIYPKDLVQEVINNLEANFIVPYSNKAEEKFAKSLKEVTPVKLDLNRLKALISRADLLIGNDTGPSYMAWANNIPSIILFGPVPPNRVYSDKKTILLKSPSKVDPYKLNKNDFSISKIDPMMIVKEARKFL